MYRGTLRLMAAMGIFLAARGADAPGQTDALDPSYHHGYYLFLAGTPQGCEDCYVPLLLTRKSIEDLKENPTPEDCVLITTFERDSIWHYDGLARIGRSAMGGAGLRFRGPVPRRHFHGLSRADRDGAAPHRDRASRVPVAAQSAPSENPAAETIAPLAVSALSAT